MPQPNQARPYDRFQARMSVARLEQDRRRISEPLTLTNQLAALTPEERARRESELRRTLPER